MGILTVGVVTKPFQFEGERRMRFAEAGIVELQKHVDTLLVIPNQNLFRVANEKTTFADAFAMADQVLYSGVACITDLMVKEGLINLDFADVRAVMREMGKAMMGTGEASGEKRAITAAEAAISNPLIDDNSMKGARGLLISITGGKDLTLYEVDEAATRIREEVDKDANIIVGATFDESLEGIIRVSVVATGIDKVAPPRPSRPRPASVREPMASAPAERAARAHRARAGRRRSVLQRAAHDRGFDRCRRRPRPWRPRSASRPRSTTSPSVRCRRSRRCSSSRRAAADHRRASIRPVSFRRRPERVPQRPRMPRIDELPIRRRSARSEPGAANCRRTSTRKAAHVAAASGWPQPASAGAASRRAMPTRNAARSRSPVPQLTGCRSVRRPADGESGSGLRLCPAVAAGPRYARQASACE